MKKIIILIPATGIPHHVVKFALDIARTEPCKINGLFLWSTGLPDEDSYGFPSDIDSTDTDFTSASDEEEARNLLDANIRLFENQCKENSLPYTVHNIANNHLDTILDESAFADLLICDDKIEATYYSVHNLIASSHCPVLMVPVDGGYPEEILFAYDGNSSSIHAMKIFTYLFPSWQNLKVYLVSVLQPNILQMEYDALAREWILLHYPNAEVVILKGEVRKEIANFINSKKNCVVVLGAFGRNALSRFLKESLALAVLKKTQSPLFITH